MSTHLIETPCQAIENGEAFQKMSPKGLFEPKSAARKGNREQVTLLGGPAAAVLQIAHPKVARGVADHSNFRNDSYGRLKRTSAAVRAIFKICRNGADF